jgi:predicted membrane metal-binding protein
MNIFPSIILGASVAIVLALVWVSYLREKRPDPYKDITNRPTIPAVVIDIDMPFGSMVLFFAKLALAGIPALIIVMLVVSVMLALLSIAGLSSINRPF